MSMLVSRWGSRLCVDLSSNTWRQSLKCITLSEHMSTTRPRPGRSGHAVQAAGEALNLMRHFANQKLLEASLEDLLSQAGFAIAVV